MSFQQHTWALKHALSTDGAAAWTVWYPEADSLLVTQQTMQHALVCATDGLQKLLAQEHTRTLLDILLHSEASLFMVL